jgi:hypothetical protein
MAGDDEVCGLHAWSRELFITPFFFPADLLVVNNMAESRKDVSHSLPNQQIPKMAAVK